MPFLTLKMIGGAPRAFPSLVPSLPLTKPRSQLSRVVLIPVLNT